MPYMICSGPEPWPSPGVMCRLRNRMNASASLVNPSRSMAYTAKAASRTQAYR